MNALFNYILRLADTSLVLSHQLAIYSSHGPFLEEDLAISNVALDHIGQAEQLLKYAAVVEDKGRVADDLAYKRAEQEFFNVQLVETPNSNFAVICARQFLIDAYNFFNYKALCNSADETIAAIAKKSLKEVKYHLRRSTEWMKRLGKGTEESHNRIQNAINQIWQFTPELFEMDEIDNELLSKNISVDLKELEKEWVVLVTETLKQSGLEIPVAHAPIYFGKKGQHTENLGHILSDMQYLPRAYPTAVW